MDVEHKNTNQCPIISPIITTVIILLQLVVIFEFYYFYSTPSFWENIAYKFSEYISVQNSKFISMLFSFSIIGATYFMALFFALLGFNTDASKSTAASASEAIWEFVYRPKLLYLAYLTSWPYNKEINRLNIQVFHKGKILTQNAINELYKRRITELKFLIPIILLYAFFVDASYQKIFFMGSLLSLGLANTFFDLLWFSISKSLHRTHYI